MKQAFIFFILNIIIIDVTIAQEVEHNFLVGPQTTNCDSLDIVGLSQTESILLIRASKYRFDQSFLLTRKQGLQLGEYYSCDNEQGFLIIRYDGKENLYYNIDKLIWKELISSSDPEGYYLNNRQQFLKHP